MATSNFTQDGNGRMVPQNEATASTGVSNDRSANIGTTSSGEFTDAQLLDFWRRWKKESFDQRWIYERQWMRNVWYMLNRQWIYYDSKRGQWQDKRLAKWIPRPVTNILQTGVDSVRSNFAQISYGANARPLGEDNENVIAAGVADDYAPLLHEEHKMDHVMNEFDFWMLVTGNAWLHTAVSYERENGMTDVNYETCVQCQTTSSEIDISNAGQKCPACTGTAFMPATNEDGSPMVDSKPLPKGITMPLSPFEIAYPIMYENFDMSPLCIRMRWRDKSYYEQNDEFKDTYAKTLAFSKTPQERTMQIFKTLPFQGDIGITPPYFASGGANVDTEGVVEYDVWIKPCADFPDGQVIRIAGDAAPVVIHSERENLPGPLPYHSANGNPIFTFHHARYRHVGGRSYGSGLIDSAIQKQDQLNQVDSHILMVIGRMANPIWLEPKGAEVEKFTGEPGLVVKWNPLIAGGNAKPERIPGEGINSTVFSYRELVKQEAEELMGTFDIMKGQKPSGTEAYAAMSFLYERATGRHASAYQSRGAAYKGWYGDALSIEQEFGPEDRVKWTMGPNKAWAKDVFRKTDLKGNVEIIIEDGTLMPKTLLGERAAVDHLAQLGLLDPNDPDQKIEIYRRLGQSSLMPGIDAQVQEAWMNMDKFERFFDNPQAMQLAVQASQAAEQAQQASQAIVAAGGQAPPMPQTQVGPLIYRRWYNPQIHRNELIKWCLSDRGRSVFSAHQSALQMVDAYLMQIDLAIAQAASGIMDAGGEQLPVGPGGTGAQGGQQPPQGNNPNQQGAAGRGQQMRNSTQNSAGAGPTSSGPAGKGSVNPAQQGLVESARVGRAASYLDKANPSGQ